MSLDWGSWSDRFRWRVSRRGNVVELWATPGAIGDQAARLTGEPIRALTIENADVAGVAAISLRAPFRNLRQLSVEANGLSGDLVATLVERLHSPRLHSLSLARVQLEGTGPRWRKVLAGAASLERLELTGCFTSGDAAAAFLRDARLPHVRRLLLADNGLGHGVEPIARELRGSGLRLIELGVGSNALDGPSMCRLLEGLRLEALWLTQNPLGPEGMRRIARSHEARSIRQIGLARCQLGDAGARAMTLWLGSSTLEHVHADGNGLGVASARHFAAHWRSNLGATLLLAENQLGDDGVEALVSTSAGERLRSLTLSGNGLTAKAMRALARSPHLTRLRELELSDNELGDEGAIALCESPLLGRLLELDLSANGIARVGARALADRAGRRLRSFWLLRGNEVPAMFVQTMRSHGVGVV